MKPFNGSTAPFLEGLLKANRKLELEYEWASSKGPENAARVRSVAADFLENYVKLNHISQEMALSSYAKTTLRYMRDLQEFSSTGKYPLEIDPQQWELGRTDYDLFLVLTILLTPHRCAIMEEIMKTAPSGRPLVIGVGSGIELAFIPCPQGGEAYDLYINSFARHAFPLWNFHEELYEPSGSRYGVVYAIELLEHLSEPFLFAANCMESLEPGGRFVTTIASNVPQFDHRYNFVSDDDFEGRMSSMGFEIESKRHIPHEYPFVNIRAQNARKAYNVFYVFRKKV